MSDDKNTIPPAQLKSWQQDFYQGIFNPTQGNINTACEDVVGTQLLSANQRLAIYRDSILGGITSALMAIYPVCVKLVGERFFTHMVASYLRDYPSKSPDVGKYGDRLGEYLTHFVATNEQAKDLNYLPDVARLEWLWHKAFNSAAINDLSDNYFPLSELENISSEDQGRIQFLLQPSIGLLASEYPVEKIWQMNQADSNVDTINLDEGKRELIVFRTEGFDTVIEILTEDEFNFLSALQSGACFAQVANIDFQSSIADVLTSSMQRGLLIGFKLVE